MVPLEPARLAQRKKYMVKSGVHPSMIDGPSIGADTGKEVKVALPRFEMETVDYVRIYFPDGKPNDAVRSYMKARGFIWQPPREGTGNRSFWFGDRTKLVGTPFIPTVVEVETPAVTA